MNQYPDVVSPNGIREAPRVRAVRQLRAWLADGTLSGHPLPSERSLSESLAVDRGTVRRALAMLEREGALKVSGNGAGAHSRAKSSSGWMEHAVAVVTEDLTTMPSGHRTGWMGLITRGILDALAEAGWHGITLHPNRLSGPDIEGLLAHPPAGIITSDFVTAGFSPSHALNRFVELGVHVAVYGESPGCSRFDRVTSDHAGGGGQITKWLLERGRRRILQLTIEPGTAYWFVGRRQGYLAALAEAGVEPMPSQVLPGPCLATEADFEDHVRRVAGYLVPHMMGPGAADAILAPTDIDVPALAAACRLFGKEPNRDVWLVGYDHLWPECDTRGFLDIPPLVTMDKNNLATGRALVELLFERMAGKLPPTPQCRVVAPTLIELAQPRG